MSKDGDCKEGCDNCSCGDKKREEEKMPEEKGKTKLNFEKKCIVCESGFAGTSIVQTVDICPECSRGNIDKMYTKCRSCGYVHFVNPTEDHPRTGMPFERYDFLIALYMQNKVKEIVFTGTGLVVIVHNCPDCKKK